MNEEQNYNVGSLFGGSADPSRTQKKLSNDERKRKRYLEKLGRKANRGSSKGQKSGTGRKNW